MSINWSTFTDWHTKRVGCLLLGLKFSRCQLTFILYFDRSSFSHLPFLAVLYPSLYHVLVEPIIARYYSASYTWVRMIDWFHFSLFVFCLLEKDQAFSGRRILCVGVVQNFYRNLFWYLDLLLETLTEHEILRIIRFAFAGYGFGEATSGAYPLVSGVWVLLHLF